MLTNTSNDTTNNGAYRCTTAAVVIVVVVVVVVIPLGGVGGFRALSGRLGTIPRIAGVIENKGRDVIGVGTGSGVVKGIARRLRVAQNHRVPSPHAVLVGVDGAVWRRGFRAASGVSLAPIFFWDRKTLADGLGRQ